MVTQIVGNADFQDILLLKGIGDIKGKGGVAAGMDAEIYPVKCYISDLIHCTEMEQYPLFPEAFRQRESLAVNQILSLGKVTADAGQTALWAERYQNGQDIALGLQLPNAVKVYITISL